MGFFSYDLEGQAAIAGQKKSGGGSHWPDKHNRKIPKGVLGLMGFFSYDLEGQAGAAGSEEKRVLMGTCFFSIENVEICRKYIEEKSLLCCKNWIY
jgi:hypothetical protein